MARIRTIKPELLTDQKASALDDHTWRLFVSSLLLADDHGRFPADPRQLHAAVFWGTDTSSRDTRESLAKLSEAGLLTVYRVRGQQFAVVNGWAKHQKVDHPGKPLCPDPNEAESLACDANSREPRESLANIPESLAPDRDQYQDQDLQIRSAEPDLLLESPSAQPEPEQPKKHPDYPAEFEAVWTGTGKSGHKFAAFKAWKAQGRPASADVIAGWDWARTHDKRWPNFVPHLSSWLNARGWEDRPGKSPPPPPKTEKREPAKSLCAWHLYHLDHQRDTCTPRCPFWEEPHAATA